MKHTVNFTYQSPSGAIPVAVDVVAEQSVELDVSIATNAVNYEVDFSFTRSLLKSILLTCDQNLTVKTNSSGSPQETIALVANIPFVWATGFSPESLNSHFAGDVTKLYVTNTSGTAVGTFKIRAMMDPTP